MNNIPNVKIGIIVGSTDWLPSEIAINNRKKLVENYVSKYGAENIFECSICLTDNEANLKRALKEIENAECNALCIYFANYGPESAGTLLAQKFKGPVMMIAAADDGEGPYIKERKDALTGFINACYALKLRSTNVYIPTHPCGRIEQCSDMIHDFFAVARTILALKELKLISFGPRPSSYLAACAPAFFLYDIGVEISEYSELELLNSFQKHENDARITKTIESMKQDFGDIKTPDILQSLAQFELTLEDWIRGHKGDRKYITLTSTCWPAFPVNFGFVPCYVHSRLTAKGYPVACEVDAYGAVTEYIGQCVSNDIVTILNINNNIPKELYNERIKNIDFDGHKYALNDLFLGYHCGVTPACKLNKTSLDYHFVNKQLIGEEKSKGTIQGTLQAGGITIFRLQGTRDGILRAYIAEGNVLPVEMDTYGGQGIIAIPEMERFIRNVVIEKQYPNHCAVLFGHYGKKLMAVLKSIGVKDIDYNHPKDVPYPNEDVFDK